MRVNLPRNDQPLTKVVARAGEWSIKRYLGPLQRECELPIPEGIDPKEVEVTAEGCDDSGKPVEPAVVLKAATKPKAPVPVIEPIQETKQKPKPERRKPKWRDQEIARDERPQEQPLTDAAIASEPE